MVTLKKQTVDENSIKSCSLEFMRMDATKSKPCEQRVSKNLSYAIIYTKALEQDCSSTLKELLQISNG